jgi:hypothetical protein
MVMTRRMVLGACVVGMSARAIGASGPAWGQTAEKPFMKVEFAFSGQVFTATLLDNPSARDFASLLPLTLKIDDYSTNEKIAYLPRKLTEAGSGAFGNEVPGDLAYYAPWGNLVFYHAGYHYSQGLIRLGRLDGGIKPLLTRGQFPLTAKLVG